MNTPHLDPATCMALKPIVDSGNRAMSEQDVYRGWTVGLALTLGIPISGFASNEVSEQYAELRERITKAVKEMKA